MVKPQQKRRSMAVEMSFSASAGLVSVIGTADAGAWSSSSSSSMTNCVPSELRACDTSTTSFFHRSSSSNSVTSISKTTGRMRSRTRRQFKTSLLLLSMAAPGDMGDMREDAKPATEGVLGKLWSSMSWNSRADTARMSVATFSGAMESARRTAPSQREG